MADAADSAALADLVRSTKAVVSTVGPFAVHGSPLVAAAVEAGTDYCDSTGEPQWIRRMIDEHTTAAEMSGARLVPACGFDSVPSDLGVWHLQQLSMERFGEPCETVAMRVASLEVGASGGTMASMMNVVDEASSDPTLRGFPVRCPRAQPRRPANRPHLSGSCEAPSTTTSLDSGWHRS